MNKKILLGSIIAVVILVLVSFTGVVGYQTTSTTIAKASPLFSIRSKRAIGEESKDLTCDYVGKGDTFLLPKRNNKIVLIRKFIERISNMEDRAFNSFINFICRKMQLDEKFDTEHILQIKDTLNILRKNPGLLTKYFNERIIEEQPLGITSGNICDFIFELLYSLFFAIATIFVAIQSWFAGTDCLYSVMCPATSVTWPCS